LPELQLMGEIPAANLIESRRFYPPEALICSSNGLFAVLAPDPQLLRFFAAHFNTVDHCEFLRPRAGDCGAAKVGSSRRMSLAMPGRIKYQQLVNG
jgi:hypothetical protein